MIQHKRNGIEILWEASDSHCRMSLRPRLTAGQSDEACQVTELDIVLEQLLALRVRDFEIDLRGLREIDESGISLLRRLQERAAVTLLLPQGQSSIEPLTLAIVLYTKFAWRSLSKAA